MDKPEILSAIHVYGMEISPLYFYIGFLVLIPISIYFSNKFVETITLRKFFIKIPIIAGLALCEWKDFKSALYEFSVKSFLSSWPILIGAFAYLCKHGPDGAITSNVAEGQLYLFCGSMLSSIFYFAMKDRGEADGDERESRLLFPSRMTHVLVVFALTLGSALIYGYRKADILLPEYILVEVSYYYLVTVIFLAIVASTINNALNGNALKYSLEVTQKFNKTYEPGKGKEQ